MLISSRDGGCIFAENPDRDCASLLPLWSADVDPHVLSVRVATAARGGARLFDAAAPGVRVLNGHAGEHLLVDLGGDVVRLDAEAGLTAVGPVTLCFDLADDDRLEAQLTAIRTFRLWSSAARRHARLARHLVALHALDARDAGASLRDVAGLLFGPGDWPGDGEHRKSRIRRLIAAGNAMLRAGPRGILATA